MNSRNFVSTLDEPPKKKMRFSLDEDIITPRSIQNYPPRETVFEPEPPSIRKIKRVDFKSCCLPPLKRFYDIRTPGKWV